MNNISTQPEAWPARKTTELQSTRLGEIEVLRAIAVLMVLLEHLSFNLLFWHSNLSNFIYRDTGLWSGVDLFFTISGFVIARSLLPRLAGVTDWVTFTRIAVTFWIARAWRLMPSAWLWLTIPLALCLIFNRSGAYETFAANWSLFVAGVFDLANFHMALIVGHKPLGVAFAQWSLSLEEQFYLLLPFAAFFCRRYLVIPLLVIAAAGFIVPNSPIVTLLRLWPVASGVLLAIWSSNPSYFQCAPTGLSKSRLARIAVLAILLAGLVSVGSLSLQVVSFYQGPVTVICVIMVWIASYDQGYLWRKSASRRAMEAIAARSYSLYLVHIPVYFAAHEIWFRLYSVANPNSRQAVAIVGSALLAVFIVAELNHRLLEKPLREHGKRLAATYRTTTALNAV